MKGTYLTHIKISKTTGLWIKTIIISFVSNVSNF